MQTFTISHITPPISKELGIILAQSSDKAAWKAMKLIGSETVNKDYRFTVTNNNTQHTEIWVGRCFHEGRRVCPFLSRESQHAEKKPGVLNDYAKWYFMSGQCHTLAQVIHERYAYPLYIIEVDIGAVHVVCRMGPDTFVDIEGIRTAEELKKHFLQFNEEQPDYYKFYPIDDIEILVSEWSFYPMRDIEYAKSLVDLLIPQ